jgi:hypothetical protein
VRHLSGITAAGLIFGLVVSSGGLRASPPTQVKKGEVCTTDGCGKYGTSVTFVETPSDAARQAAKEEKLVFVLHVSGNFEDPKFT